MLYCEIKAMFDDVRWREKIDRIACDAYLSKYNIGLVLGSYSWYDGYGEKDS